MFFCLEWYSHRYFYLCYNCNLSVFYQKGELLYLNRQVSWPSALWKLRKVPHQNILLLLTFSNLGIWFSNHKALKKRVFSLQNKKPSNYLYWHWVLPPNWGLATNPVTGENKWNDKTQYQNISYFFIRNFFWNLLHANYNCRE